MHKIIIFIIIYCFDNDIFILGNQENKFYNL